MASVRVAGRYITNSLSSEPFKALFHIQTRLLRSKDTRFQSRVLFFGLEEV